LTFSCKNGNIKDVFKKVSLMVKFLNKGCYINLKDFRASGFIIYLDLNTYMDFMNVIGA